MKKDTMHFSLRTKVILFGLLVILALIFRFPTTPHEIGWDSFGAHTMANSISEFGYAKWWIHPASVIGWYPYSAVTAVPFLLSGISQCSGINVEKVILLYSLLLGIFSIFGAYLMAGVIWDNDIFKFLVAIVLSTSMGIMEFTTWTANSRTLFVISLPLFIYLLLKTRTFRVRFGILTFIVSALLLVTHHLIYFVIPIIISYLIIVMIYKSGNYIKSIKIPENVANFAVFAAFSIIFAIPFFTRTLMEMTPEESVGGSRYVWLLYMMNSYIRYIGILIVLVVSGYVYLLLKRNKKFEEWFLLLCIAGLAQFLYIITYMKWFIVPFACILIGIALTNVAIAGMRKKMQTEKRKYATVFIIIFLLLSTSFSGYYQYLHFLNAPSPSSRYMQDTTYVGGLWARDNVDKNKNMITGLYVPNRFFSISEVPTLTGASTVDLAYGFVDPKKLEVERIYPVTSLGFYFHDPYKAVNHSHTDSDVLRILKSDINNPRSKALRFRLISLFNLSYYVESKERPNTFGRSVQQTKDNLYDNGRIRIWDLK